MAFSKTSSSSRADLLSQVLAFAIANAGFTDLGSFTVATYTFYMLSKGGVTYYFYVEGTRIQFRMSLTSASAWPGTDSSSRYPSGMTTQAFAGPYPSLYLYTDGDAVAVCVELTTGIFNHMSFGKITKTDTLDGGEFTAGGYYMQVPGTLINPSANNNPPFLYGVNSIGSVHDYILQKSPIPTNDYRDFACFGYLDPTSAKRAAGSLVDGINSPLFSRSPNTATQRTILFNNYILLLNSTSGLWQCAGHIPIMRGVNMRNVDPATLLYTDWQCFPITEVNGSGANIPNGWYYGIAYKRA